MLSEERALKATLRTCMQLRALADLKIGHYRIEQCTRCGEALRWD